jgi:hypothetical protein
MNIKNERNFSKKKSGKTIQLLNCKPFNESRSCSPSSQGNRPHKISSHTQGRKQAGSDLKTLLRSTRSPAGKRVLSALVVGGFSSVKRARGSIMLYTNKELPRVLVVCALWDRSDFSWIPLPRNASFRASTVWILAVCSDLETEVKEGMEFFVSFLCWE